MYNLLSEFSPDSNCILTNYRKIRTRKTTGTWLQCKYFFWDLPNPTEGIAHGSTASDIVAQSSGGVLRIAESKVPYPVARMLFLNGYPILSIIKMVRAGLDIVREENIRYILATFDGGPAFIATYIISKLTGVPYFLFTGDIYVGNSLDSPVLELLGRIFERPLFRAASTLILNNLAGERFYRRRYGNTIKCAILHNAVPASVYQSKRTPYNPVEPYRIVFTGTVYWAQERSLLNLVSAIDELRDLPLQLDLYVPYADETFKRTVGGRPNIHLLPAAPQAEMPEIQCDATILFIPLAWHSKSPYLVASVTPGKLSEYLASGRPILIHVPPYTYMAEYARRNGFALVVDEEDKGKLKDGIRKLLFDLDYSRKVVENALKTFERDHDALANAKRLIRILDSAEGPIGQS